VSMQPTLLYNGPGYHAHVWLTGFCCGLWLVRRSGTPFSIISDRLIPAAFKHLQKTFVGTALGH